MNYLEKIIKLVKSGKIKTKYSHFNLIYRRRKTFIFSVDCSGLVEFWLKKKHSEALQEIYAFVYQARQVSQKQIKRLYSFDFYDFFEKGILSESLWKLVRIEEPLQRGDVVACINEEQKGRFGHVAVVEKELYRDENVLRLQVIDSSAMEHFCDERPSEKKGIGRGILELHLQNGVVSEICYMPECSRARKVLIGRLK